MGPYGPENGFCATILSQYDPQLLDRFKLEMSYGIERFFLLSYCLACCWPGLGAKSELRIVRQWPELEFVFPNEQAYREATDKRYYVPGNSVPIDVDVHHRQGDQKSRIFITIPRFDEGRPMTLGTVDDTGRVSAYPDYSWHENQGQNCNGFTSVFRIAIDECNRLWAMDTGKIGDKDYCPPKVVAFDLATDNVVYTHIVNASSYIPTSLFITPVVDVRKRGTDCSDTYVYVADVSGFGILVVDVARNRSWRITHRLMFPYPSRGTFTIDGQSFDLMDGILGMALSPLRNNGIDRDLYFHALASTTENVVPTSLLRNESYLHDSNADPQSIKVFAEERPNQAAAEAMDRNGIMYFGLMEPPSIWCWNAATEFSPRNFHQLAVNRETLQFASGVKIVNNLKGEQELWVLTSSFQRVMTDTLSSNRINFRIHAEKIKALVENSPCKNSPKERHGSHRYHANLITPSRGYKSGTYKYGAVSYL